MQVPYQPSPGDLVFVKVKGHPVWPARIQARAGEKFEVYFYGTAEQATLKSKAIWPYNEENKAQFCNPAARKRKGYLKGLEEIEKTPEMAAVVFDNHEEIEETPEMSAVDTDNNDNSPVVIKKPDDDYTDNSPVVIKKPIKKLVQQPGGGSDIMEVSQSEVDEVTILQVEVEDEANTGMTVSKSEVSGHAFPESFSVGSKVFAKWVDWKRVSFYPAEVVERVSEQILKVKFLEGEIEMDLSQESDVISALQLQAGNMVMVNHSQLEAYRVTAMLLHQPTQDESNKLTFQYTDKYSGEPKTASHSEVSLTNLQASTVLRGRGLVPTTNKVSAHIDYENLVFGKRMAASKETPTSLSKMKDNLDATSKATSRSRSRSKSRQIKSIKVTDELAKPDQDAMIMDKEASESLSEIKVADEMNNFQEEAKEDISDEKREVWVKVKATGELIKLNVDQDKPTEWENKQQALEWDLATARNAVRLQKQVGSGLFLPVEVVRALDQKVQLSSEEEKVFRHQATLIKRRKKVAWLKTEQDMVDIDIGIKTSLSRSDPQLPGCLEHLSRLLVLPLQPLMLLKRPELVDTLTKLKSYAGPVDLAGFDPAEKGKIMKEVRKIKKLSATVMDIVLKLFPDISTEGGDIFLESFRVEVEGLRERTSDWPEDRRLFMTELPLLPTGSVEDGAQVDGGQG